MTKPRYGDNRASSYYDLRQWGTRCGDTTPSFTLPGVDGQEHSLADYADARILVLLSWSHICPWSEGWEARVKRMVDEYRDEGVTFVAINSCSTAVDPRNSFEEMIKAAKERAYNFDYLHDESQQLARFLGCVTVPEAFAYTADRRLYYRGAIDSDIYDTTIWNNYLRTALDNVLGGRHSAIGETFVRGSKLVHTTIG